jgi:hypothetical protein
MDLFTSRLEDEEMSLRELAMPSMVDIKMQKSDLALATTEGPKRRTREGGGGGMNGSR